MPMTPISIERIPREGAAFTLRGPGMVGDGWAIVCPAYDMLVTIVPQADATVVVRPNGSSENSSGVQFIINSPGSLQDGYIPAGMVVLVRNAGGAPVLVMLREPPLTALDLAAILDKVV